MTSTSQDTRQPACSRTQVRLRVNFGSLGSYGVSRWPRWILTPTRVGDGFRRRTVRAGPLRSRDGLGSTSWPSTIGPTSTAAVEVGMTAESSAPRPRAAGSHWGKLGLHRTPARHGRRPGRMKVSGRVVRPTAPGQVRLRAGICALFVPASGPRWRCRSASAPPGRAGGPARRRCRGDRTP
jgi:hypothetical protein